MNNLRLFALPDLRDIKTELIRKSIHFLIAASPGMAALNRPLAIAFLGAGVLVYTAFESLRLFGVKVPLVSGITAAASRPRDEGHFVLGPVSLGLGALLAILFFPPLAAAVAVYALAFGDGFASIVGKLFGRNRPAFLYGKSIEGSLACFTAVYIAAWRASSDFGIALFAALAASVTEALPLEDLDNLAIPLAVGFVVTALL
jgi:dolichol kinase